MIDQATLKWIKAVLSNDEMSSDKELYALFVTEGKLTSKEARAWLAKRNHYINNIVMDWEG